MSLCHIWGLAIQVSLLQRIFPKNSDPDFGEGRTRFCGLNGAVALRILPLLLVEDGAAESSLYLSTPQLTKCPINTLFCEDQASSSEPRAWVSGQDIRSLLLSSQGLAS